MTVLSTIGVGNYAPLDIMVKVLGVKVFPIDDNIEYHWSWLLGPFRHHGQSRWSEGISLR